MKRRSFLAATSATAAALTLRPWQPAAAVPREPNPDGPAVTLRSGLSHIATTVDGVTADGTLTDPRWGPPVQEQFTSLAGLEETDPVALHLVHDSTHLHVGIAVSGTPASTVAYASVLVRADSEHFVTTVAIRPTTPASTFTWEGENTELSDATSDFAAGDDLTTATVSIPFAEIGISPDTGVELGLNVVVDHEDMTRPATSDAPLRTGVIWYNGSSTRPVRTAVVDEDRYALVLLGGVGAVRKGRKPAALSEISLPVLEYLAFSRKRLHLQIPDDTVRDEISIDWRAPGGDWVGLETEVAVARIRTADFDHPEPTVPGQYWLRVTTVSRTGDDQVSHLWFDRDALITAGDQLPGNQPHPPRGNTEVTPAAPSAAVQALLDLVPDRAGFRFCGLPETPELHPDRLYAFSPDEPDQLVAPSTGTVYPNDDFPEDQSITVTNRLGEEVTYPYHEDASGKRYFISAHRWYLQREHVYGALPTLASTDPLGAARLLHRLAEAHRGWVSTNEYPWFNRPVASAATPRNYYWGGALTRWSVSDLSPISGIAGTLEKIEQTDALDVLGAELGTDVRSVIIDDFLGSALAWVHTFPATYGNMAAPNNVALGSLAKALGDSQYAHEVYEWAAEFARRSFLFDGFWKETTVSYHNQSSSGAVAAADKLDGWTDAEGYESPRTGLRLVDLKLRTKMPVLSASLRIPNLLCYPDTKTFPTADTWASEKANAPEPIGSFTLGASGISRLSRGPVASGGPYGITHQFFDLTVTEQSAEAAYFAGTGTIQLESTTPDGFVVWEFDLDTGGDFDLDLVPFHAGSYARYEVRIDGEAVGEHDFFASGATGVQPAFTLARIDLTAGKHTIGFHCVGRDEGSSNWKMGINSMSLLDEEARTLRDESDPDVANPAQTWLMYTPKYGHNHYDPLNLVVWAEGQELLPDLGYTHTFDGQWTKTTLGHNTVTVDSSNMSTETGVDGGSLEVFDTADTDIQAIRAHFDTAYDQTNRYCREVWSIKHPDAERNEGYVLDLFRVAGGERHELSFNGDANHEAAMTTTASTAEYGPYLLPEGVEVVLPTRETETGSAEGHYYGYISVRDVSRAELPDGAFDVTLTTELDDEEEGSGVHFLGQAGPSTELFLGRSPSIRSTRLLGAAGDLNTEVIKYTMPKLVVRREGSDLRSDFVTVVEPYGAGKTPRISSVELVEHDGSADDLAVKVTHDDGTVDLVLSSFTGSGTLSAEDATLTGKLGWVRMSEGEVVALHLVGGTSLTAGGQSLTDDGPVTGPVTGTRRQMAEDETDAVLTTATVPEWAVGRTLVVAHPDGKTHAYPIKAVTAEGGTTLIEIDRIDPGFQINDDGSSEMVFTPFTVWTGDTTFRIDNSVTS